MHQLVSTENNMAELSGVEVLQSEIEKSKDKLRSYNENIKKLTGRDPNRPGVRRLLSGEGEEREEDGYSGRMPRGRGRLFGLARRGIMDDNGPPTKRRIVGGAFSRLGPSPAPARRREREDSPYEEELPTKLSVQSSVVSTSRETKSREEIMQEQSKDKDGLQRNKRMFGLLLGTLNRFKTESKTLETKEVQRKKIEEKLEEIAEKEKKKYKLETKLLMEEMHLEQSKISRLEQKMEMVQEHAERAKEMEKLKNFIATKTKPRIFWKPAQSSALIDNKLKESKKVVDEMLQEGQDRLEKEIKELMEREYKREERIKMRLREDGLFGDEEEGVEEGNNKSVNDGSAGAALDLKQELEGSLEKTGDLQSKDELRSKSRRVVVLDNEKEDESESESEEGDGGVRINENKGRDDVSHSGKTKGNKHIKQENESSSEEEEAMSRRVVLDSRESEGKDVRRSVKLESNDKSLGKRPHSDSDEEDGQRVRERILDVKKDKRREVNEEKNRRVDERLKKDSLGWSSKSKQDGRHGRRDGHEDKKHVRKQSRDKHSDTDSSSDSDSKKRKHSDSKVIKTKDHHSGPKKYASAERGDNDMDSDDQSKH